MLQKTHPDPTMVFPCNVAGINSLKKAEPNIFHSLKTDKRTPFCHRFFSIIEKNYSDSEFNVNKISTLFCLCPMQLHRKVVKHTGFPPGQLLLKYRLLKAFNLLIGSEFNISEISFQTGFGSPSHFSKTFKKTFGETPNKIRKDYLNNVIKTQKEVINGIK